MPLCRISLQSPAGAARGQVRRLSCLIHRLHTFYALDLSDLSVQADDIENEANELIRIKNYLYGKLAGHTGHSVEKVKSFFFFLSSRFGG
jgi:ATP-dependent Clp protease, protease subunit